MALKDFLRLLFIVLCLICLVGCDLKNRYFLSYSPKQVTIDKSIINLQWEGSLVGRQIIADNYSRKSLVDNWDVILAEDNPSNIEASPEKIFFNAIDHLDVTAVSNYISRGGDVDIQRNGHTALIEILIDIYLRGYHTRETTEMLEMLIDAGADINGRATGERFEHFKDQSFDDCYSVEICIFRRNRNNSLHYTKFIGCRCRYRGESKWWANCFNVDKSA